MDSELGEGAEIRAGEPRVKSAGLSLAEREKGMISLEGSEEM